jgi:NAD(P)-dependent dehydrogenase (short-subunit alcohol dehydrogenase family)
MELSNKVCLVTGGAGNIGFYITAALMKEGARVVTLDIRETKLEGVESISGEHSLKLLDIWTSSPVHSSSDSLGYLF